MNGKQDRIKKVKEGLNSDIYARLDQLDNINIDVNTPTDKLANILDGYLTKVDNISFQEELKDLKILEEKEVELEVDDEELLRAYNDSLHENSGINIQNTVSETVENSDDEDFTQDVFETDDLGTGITEVTENDSVMTEDELLKMLDDLTQEDLDVDSLLASEIVEEELQKVNDDVPTLDFKNEDIPSDDDETLDLKEEVADDAVTQQIKELEKEYNNLLETLNLEDSVDEVEDSENLSEEEVKEQIKELEKEYNDLVQTMNLADNVSNEKDAVEETVDEQIKELEKEYNDLVQTMNLSDEALIENDVEQTNQVKEKKKSKKTSIKKDKKRKSSVEELDLDGDKQSKISSIIDKALTIILLILIVFLVFLAYNSGLFDSLLGG